MGYYYLIASLPELRLGQTPPYTLDEFLASNILLGEQEREDIARTLAENADEHSHPFAQAWRENQTQLRNAVAKVRMNRTCKLNDDCLQEHSGFSAYIEQEVEAAFALDNPLETELHLDRTRWHTLDELVAEDDYFGFSKILAFTLKLTIAGRWAALDDKAAERGAERLESLAGEAIARNENGSTASEAQKG